VENQEVYSNESLEFYGKLRDDKGISITSITKEVMEGLIIYTAVGKMGDRIDSASGAQSLDGLSGEAKANAFKSAETQAKARLTISFTGIRHGRQVELGTPSELVPPPVMPVALEVNQAPAAVVADTRKPEPETAEAAAAPTVVTLPSVFAVTERQLANMHQEAAADMLTSEDPADGLFESAPPAVSATAALESLPPNKVLELATAVAPTLPPAPPPPPVAPTKTENPDDLPPGTASPAFKAFTARCTTIVRDVLPKAGEKNGSVLLTQYIAAKTGKAKLGDVTSAQWAALLLALETAGNPQKTLAIIRAK